MENQERKFVCKNCSKTFTNCRRLGGHMRSHVTKKSKLRNFNRMGFNPFQEVDDSSYKLRENPKRTWRVSVSDRKQSTNLIINRGLTRCHFKREKEECKRSRGSILCEDNQPGIETLCPIKKKRSKLSYKVSGFCSDIKFSKFNEFDREEEAALGLMMLPSGFTKWVDFISDFNSSENDSLISKAKALHKDEMKLNSTVSCSEKNGYEFGGFEMKFSETVGVESTNKKDLGSNQDASKTKSGEFKKPVMGENFEIIFSDSEIENESELIGVELGSKNDFRSNQAFSEINSECFNNFEINLFDSEMEKGSEAVRVELGNEKYLELNQAGTEINYRNFKKPVTSNDFEINFPHFVIEKESTCRANQEASFDGTKLADSISVISEKCEEKLEFKFKCKTCNKKFPSFQALGGHRAKKCDEKKFEMKISKNKYIHECPICFKIFPSGQALGGHKRAHFNFENKNEGVTDFSFLKNVHFREAMVG